MGYEDLRRDGPVRGLWSLHKDLPGEGHPTRPQRLSFALDRLRGSLHGLCRVRGGLPCRGVRRGHNIGERMRRVHPIEAESYRILREQVDLSHLGPLSRAVAERVIHASADLDYAESLVLDEAALKRGISALRRGFPVVTDVGMVAAGITGYEPQCFVSDHRALSEEF